MAKSRRNKGKKIKTRRGGVNQTVPGTSGTETSGTAAPPQHSKLERRMTIRTNSEVPSTVPEPMQGSTTVTTNPGSTKASESVGLNSTQVASQTEIRVPDPQATSTVTAPVSSAANEQTGGGYKRKGKRKSKRRKMKSRRRGGCIGTQCLLK